MRIVSLGSGSQGNATIVQWDDDAILVDCGFNYKTLCSRLTEAFGSTDVLERVKGVLLTHSHGDHTRGLRVLLDNHPEIAVYANSMTAETTIREEKLVDPPVACFENGQNFEVGPFQIHPFSVPHDTSDPVGYLIKGDEIYFHATDFGTPLDSIGGLLAQADVATLESNHDLQLLFASNRPQDVIRRISGPRGHLSNDQAATLVRRFASPNLKRLALGHLSHDCNAEHLVVREMTAVLEAIRRTDLAVSVLSQDHVTVF